MLVDDEDVPLGLVLEADVPLPVPPVVDDEELPIPLLEVPPMPEPELGLVVELDDELGGVLGVVVVEEEDEDPPGTTTVSRVVLVEVLLGGVVEPPGITVVVSFFSQADKANAPTTAKSIPLRLIFTLLSSERPIENCTRPRANTVPLRWRCVGIGCESQMPCLRADSASL
ncbi:MAG TPA: hypothetical protein VFI62_15645 [Burkholderiales bacterium]|nr:hypothetical protein [Burkholderiales bacterium]